MASSLATKIVDGGAGYTTAPAVTVPDLPGAAAKVGLSFGAKFETSGSIATIAVSRGNTQ